MTRSDQWKMLSVVLATALSIWYLLPSFRYYSMTPAQRSALPATELDKLRDQSIHLGLDLQGGMHLALEVDRSRLKPAEAQDATDRAMEIIRNRIDQFGVAEPLVQREGDDRIVVQLPGLTDRERAIDLIGKTALLEFKLLRSPEEVRNIFDRLDSYLAARGAGAGVDSALRRTPLTGHFIGLEGNAFVRQEELGLVEQLLATAGVDSIVPRDSQLLWGPKDDGQGGVSGRALYVVKREPEMTGGSIANAQAQVGLESTNPGAWGVSMTMTPRGRSDFARVTGNNVGRQLAIVLDEVVSSAPNIRERIPSGDASITGGDFTAESAKDLSIVLRAGALPAPVRIIEERSVGPSLGSDSIRQGVMAGWIGSLLVIVFMAFYYRLSGLIAIAALALNVLYVIALLAGFGATLTLPGIAGLVLSIGMAVDANVLIFERIREELRAQKTVRQSVATGYDRAFRTIFDSNLTVILSCLCLFQFGTGPIKGFAVTMIIGLVANVFTAVLFTRLIYDFMLSRGKVERLSI